MSNKPRPKMNMSVFNRATPDSKFYVDYAWWNDSDLDLKTYLYSRLGIEDDQAETDIEFVDLIHPQTGEVSRVDGFQYVVQAYFNQLPDDFLSRTSLVDAVFCTLLANANQPMTAEEIAKRVNRPTDVVLKTIGGPKIYQGIRPVT
jgi:hypothetical protein